MALTIKERFVNSFGPLNVEIVRLDADENIDSFQSELSRVDAVFASTEETTGTPNTPQAYVDGKTNTVYVTGRSAGSGSIPLTLVLFGY